MVATIHLAILCIMIRQFGQGNLKGTQNQSAKNIQKKRKKEKTKKAAEIIQVCKVSPLTKIFDPHLTVKILS